MSEEKGIKKFLSKIKIEYLIVIVLTVICLIFVFGGISSEKKTESKSNIDEYVSSLENKLKKNLSLVSGAGNVSVIISVASGMETVLATVKTTEDNSIKEEPFTVGGKTVVITETYPEITGVVIVAEGANNLAVRVSLINAVSVFLNIESNKIQILPM